MSSVFLKEIHFENFKGYKSRTFELSELTRIAGRNKTGKSTIFNGFSWLLFGKDQFDRKDYEIIPVIDGKRLERVDSEVSAVLLVGPKVVNLRRVLHQKWVRRRGTNEEVFDGCETRFYMNDSPMQAGEYKKFVDDIITEDLFKLITRSSAFLSLHWQKQREILFNIAGTISNADLISRLITPKNEEQFKDIIGALLSDDPDLVQLKKQLAARKKRLNEDLDAIPTKIAQTQKLCPEAEDYAALSAEITRVQGLIDDIDRQLSSRTEAVKEALKRKEQKLRDISALRVQQNDIVRAEDTRRLEGLTTAQQERSKVKSSIDANDANFVNAKKAADDAAWQSQRIAVNIQNLTKEKDTLLTRWHEENAKEYTGAKNCLVCPAFGHECADATALAKNKENEAAISQGFYKAKDEALERINKDGLSLAQRIEQLEKDKKSLDDDYIRLTSEMDACTMQASKLKEMLDDIAVPVVQAVVPEQLADWITLEQSIKQLQEEADAIIEVDNTDLTTQKAPLTQELDALKLRSNTKDEITRYKQEITRLEESARDLAQQIATIEQQEFKCADFTRAKIEESEARINNLFELVRFRLFDKTIDGNEYECCVPLDTQGVPIDASNTAYQENAGLDIIRTLSRFYNVSAPIFCDRAESVNEFIRVGSQMILLVVNTSPEIQVTHEVRS